LKFFFEIIFLLSSTFASAATVTTTIAERRFFSLAALVGVSDSRLLNSDASYTSFFGAMYGAEALFRLVTLEKAEVHLFGRYLIFQQGGKNSSVDNLQINKNEIGVRAQIGSYFYMGFGYGFQNLKIKNSVEDFTVSASGPTLGAGLDFKVSPSFILGVSSWFSTASITKQSALTTHSHLDNVALFMNLTWMPVAINKVTTTVDGR
jgi:opacity protein-like surface antigen